VDAEIAALAVRQYGNVTRRQLLELGLNDDQISRRLNTGRLHRVHPGVYSVGRRPITPPEHAAAAVLACGPGAALGIRSSSTLWGFFRHWQPPFVVILPGDRRPKGIETHRSRCLTGPHVRFHLGIRATSPARTVLDCAPDLTDKALTRMVNDALRSGFLHRSQLADMLSRFPNHAGTVRLRPFVVGERGVTRSELEDAFVAFCLRYGFPQPLLNTIVAGYELDAFFPEYKLIVELDSYGYHSDRETFESDRDRDADTLLAGLATVRITHYRITRTPDREAARFAKILEARRNP
jgi:hypothetical protein